MKLADWINATAKDCDVVFSNDTALLDLIHQTNNTTRCIDPSSCNHWHSSEWKANGKVMVECRSLADKESLTTLLGRLRDLSGQSVFAVETAQTPVLEAQNYYALGYQLVEHLDQHNVFKFSMHNYKKTPDWLNNRFWAHPERWNKDRW